LTKGEPYSAGNVSRSPHGKRIAFDAQRNPDLGSSSTQTIYLLDLADRHVKELIESAGPNGNPKWSPDGKKIVFTTFNGNPFFSYTNRYVAVVPADGGQLRLVPHEFAEDANLIVGAPMASTSAPSGRPPRTSSATTRPLRSFAALRGRMRSSLATS